MVGTDYSSQQGKGTCHRYGILFISSHGEMQFESTPPEWPIVSSVRSGYVCQDRAAATELHRSKPEDSSRSILWFG